MKLLTKLEHYILRIIRDLPHLPIGVRKWVSENIWWVAIVIAILSTLSAVLSLFAVLGLLTALSTVAGTYYAASTFVAWGVVTALVSFVFAAVQAGLLFMAVNPLKERNKKGWVLLFAAWLLGIISTVVSAILTLNPFGFITSLLFGALFAAIWGYILFEIHSQFNHTLHTKAAHTKKKS